MRPSNRNNSNTVFVLDTLPECKVVLDFLEDSTAIKPVYQDESLAAFADSTGIRFRQQTQNVDFYNTGGDPPGFSHNDSWQPNPEFKIRSDDVSFVKAAAERVLNQRKLSDKVYNKLTRRTQAARTIVTMLADR